MSRTTHKYTDIMFVVGLITAPWWCGAQAIRALTTVEGISLAQYVAFTGSFFIGALLAVEGRKKTEVGKRRVITQQVFVHSTWVLCGTFLLAIVLTRGGYVWSKVDQTITTLVLSGLLATSIWAILGKKSFADAAVRALIGISLKSLPQFLLIAKIWSEGGAGITMSAITLGHLSIFMRLIPLGMSLRTEGINREKLWLLTADGLNALSWVAVTVVWLVR